MRGVGGLGLEQGVRRVGKLGRLEGLGLGRVGVREGGFGRVREGLGGLGRVREG